MLKGKVCTIKELSNEDINTMFNLMSFYYENIKKDNFTIDLMKKSQVILLQEENTKEIMGFSTLVLYEMNVQNKIIKLLFSGDTIIHQNYWGKNDLMQVWIKNAIELKKSIKEPFYWLLISKGYKTYKYLSTLYNEFYPRYNKKTPVFEQEILDNFGKEFYPNNYDKKSGLIIMNKAKDYLKNEFAKIPDNKLTDKNIEFFINKNPEYYNGNELVCITELSVDNLNKAGRRMLGI